MAPVDRLARLMEHPWAYWAWQAPFAEQKLAPILRRGEIDRARRVLDVGCGPGTNTAHFSAAEYLGVDINPAYVDFARKRYARRFEVADVTQLKLADGERFDFVLLNSFLHHVDDASARAILGHLASLVSDGGAIHVLDLVLPEGWGVSRLLAQRDRGHHARPLLEWQKLLSESFLPEVFEPYPLGGLGVTLWNMVYFKGKRRT